MTTTTLDPAALPHARGAARITAVYNAAGALGASLARFARTLATAFEMRNRYAELSNLSDESLNRLGVSRDKIPQVVAYEAGLFAPNEVVPVAHNANDSKARTAA